MSTFPTPQPLPVTTVDGLALDAVAVGDGPVTVLYVHGFLADADYWHPLIAHLAATDTTATHITYSSRGHGRSQAPHPRAHTTFTEFARDLHAVLSVTAGPVVLVAHSMGTLIVAEYVRLYATQFRARVTATVAFNAAGEIPDLPNLHSVGLPLTALLRPMRHRILGDSINASSHRLLAKIVTRPPKRYRGRQRAQASIGDGRVLADIMTAWRHQRIDFATAAVLGHHPFRIIAAARDRTVPVEQCARLHSRVRGASLIVVEDAGHDLAQTHLDAAGSVVATAITECVVPQRASRRAKSPELTVRPALFAIVPSMKE